MRNCPLFMRLEPKAASKPDFDYGNSATAQRCFYKQAGFSLHLGPPGISWSLTGDFAPLSARRLTAGECPNGTETGDKKMARRNREVGFVKSCVLASALIAGLALPAQAQNKLALSGSATFTTDYLFRGVSNSGELPAVQPEFDLS